MQAAISIQGLSKSYKNGFEALKTVDLDIRQGEIFALLGPNGAGKTTLIGICCGTVTASTGTVFVEGHDNVRDYRAARRLIGLVPQELHTDAFESVWATVSFSRGLFGCAPNPAYVEQVLRDLSLWDKRNEKIITLSGGMKRRVLIAKALSHEPRVLFLDEPTAGVDVELRRDMWTLVRRLREQGVTIVLTTHYIEEAEEMADRIGVINRGELFLVEEKAALMSRLGKKRLVITLDAPLVDLPEGAPADRLTLSEDRRTLTFDFDARAGGSGIGTLMERLRAAGLRVADLDTRQSRLEDIFVELLHERGSAREIDKAEGRAA